MTGAFEGFQETRPASGNARILGFFTEILPVTACNGKRA
jgi:hypothetical protein